MCFLVCFELNFITFQLQQILKRRPPLAPTDVVYRFQDFVIFQWVMKKQTDIPISYRYRVKNEVK